MFSAVMTSLGVPTANILPSDISMTLSEYFAAMLRSWLIMTTMIPFATDCFFRRRITSIWCLMSRLAVGSSSRRTSGSWASPRASITLWCCPADSSLKGRIARSEMSIISSASSTTLMSSLRVFHFLWGFLPMSTVSTTLSGKLSPEVYGTYPIFFASSLGLIVDTSVSSIRTVPLDGDRSLFRQWMSVVFPAPLGPMTEMSCGLHISMSMSFRMERSLE